MVGWLVLGSKRSVVVKTTEDGFSIAGHQEIALVVGIIPPKCDSAEKCEGPVGGYFVAGVGKCVAEKIGDLLSCVFDSKIVNDERKRKIFTCCMCPEARSVFGLFEICLFEAFG